MEELSLKDFAYIEHISEDVELGAIDVIIGELGENYKDIIEMEWGMTVKAFCKTYMAYSGRRWGCSI